MGKTTEKASMMRYRRKVSTATDIKQREDNQMEHRVAELVVEGSDEKWNNEALQATPIPKPMNPNGPTRKKKPKADTIVKESVPVQVKAKESTGSLPKKKMKKRQLNDNKANNEVEIVMETLQEPLVLDAEGTKSKPVKQNSKRKNKSEANHINNKEPSLLKQLLWKPVAPPILSETLLTNEDCSLVTTTSPSSEEVAKQGHKVIKVKRMLRPSEDDEDEQAEMAYAESERHNRKLEASKKATLSHNTMSSDTCSTTAVIGGEISSQETQSGSDGEEATTEFLIAYEDLVPCNAIEPQDVVPSKAIEPQELSPAAHVDSFYPTAFPIALVSDGELLKQHGIKVHEILIEDFTFHPQQLRVQPGDVVVWKVSGETLGMVEHSLEATLSVRNSKSKKLTAVKATAPPLGSGSSFAWRFEKSSRVQIECSVYQAKGVILVGYAKLQKDKNTLVGKSAESMAQETAPTCPTTLSKPLTKQQKWKEKNAKRKQAAAAARVAEASRVGENERDRDTMEADVVFHPPHNLARSAEMDAGVCRAVLSQLEEVAATVRAADVIVVGDVECPVLPEATINSISENPADYDPHHVHPDEKPSTMADEWSGTEEDDDEEDERTSSLAEDNEIEDFQQRIIGMLKRSEEARAQHRWSFEQEKSGFDAGAAYDFFKQRFMRVQEERQIVYAMCPEQQSGCGVGLAEVVNLLSGSPA